MRTSEKSVNKILKKQIESLLAQAISDIRSPQSAKEFLSDFLTPSEKEAFVKRLAIAYWLKKERSYANIKENLKVSSATISTVQNIVDKKGVQDVLKRMEAEEWASEWSEKIKKIIGQ